MEHLAILTMMKLIPISAGLLSKYSDLKNLKQLPPQSALLQMNYILVKGYFHCLLWDPGEIRSGAPDLLEEVTKRVVIRVGHNKPRSRVTAGVAR